MITTILPCKNEQNSILWAIKKASRYSNEIIVVDNHSTDASKELIRATDAKYLYEAHIGYGNAYKKGIKEAKGDVIIMVDPDGSYNLDEIPKLIKTLETSDLVIGNRFAKMEKGAMTFPRKLWNAYLRAILRTQKVYLEETCTGFIAIKKEFLKRLEMKSGGMEFSSELLLKASKTKGKIMEVKIEYNQRAGKSKASIIDAFRHLKYIKTYRDERRLNKKNGIL